MGRSLVLLVGENARYKVKACFEQIISSHLPQNFDLHTVSDFRTAERTIRTRREDVALVYIDDAPIMDHEEYREGCRLIVGAVLELSRKPIVGYASDLWFLEQEFSRYDIQSARGSFKKVLRSFSPIAEKRRHWMTIARRLLGLWFWFPGILLHPFLAYKTYFVFDGVPGSWVHIAIVAAAIIGSSLVGSKLLK